MDVDGAHTWQAFPPLGAPGLTSVPPTKHADTHAPAPSHTCPAAQPSPAGTTCSTLVPTIGSHAWHRSPGTVPAAYTVEPTAQP